MRQSIRYAVGVGVVVVGCWLLLFLLLLLLLLLLLVCFRLLVSLFVVVVYVAALVIKFQTNCQYLPNYNGLPTMRCLRRYTIFVCFYLLFGICLFCFVLLLFTFSSE
jgi:hypothetical protein